VSDSLQIVVADDDPLLRAICQLTLEAEGHNVTLARDGHEALRMASAHPPELLVLDVSMPGMDGLEVTRRLREQPETADLPIVLLTGRATDPDIVAGWQSGANYYITKPFRIEQLQYFIRSMLESDEADEADEVGRYASVSARDLASPIEAGADGRVVIPIDLRSDGSKGDLPHQFVRDGRDFDRSIPMAIYEEYGSDSLQALLALFRSQAPHLVETASVAIGAANAEEAGRAAHTLKSSAATMGATGLAALCADLEMLARSGSIVGAAPLAAALAPRLAAALEELADIEAGLTSGR